MGLRAELLKEIRIAITKAHLAELEGNKKEECHFARETKTLMERVIPLFGDDEKKIEKGKWLLERLTAKIAELEGEVN